MGMADIKSVIWLKHVLEAWQFWLLKTCKGLFLPSSLTPSEPFGYMEIDIQTDLAQSSYFSDEQINLATEVAEMKL